MPDSLIDRLRAEDPETGLRHSIASEAADRIEALEKALRDIADCNAPREHVRIYRKDGVLSKHDGCEHGRPMYEDCDICTADFARAALEGKDERQRS